LTVKRSSFSSAAVPSSSKEIIPIIRKLEDLPSDGGKVVDTLAGANLRIFVRLKEVEEVCPRLARRIAALEAAAGVLVQKPASAQQHNGSAADHALRGIAAPQQDPRGTAHRACL
jgi:hypothetical protein